MNIWQILNFKHSKHWNRVMACIYHFNSHIFDIQAQNTISWWPPSWIWWLKWFQISKIWSKMTFPCPETYKSRYYMPISAHYTDFYDSTLTAGGHFEKYEMAPLGKTPKILNFFLDDIYTNTHLKRSREGDFSKNALFWPP